MRHKRRQILVEGFQARFVAAQLTGLVVCVALFVGALFGPLVWEINSGAVSPYDLTWATEFFEWHNRLWLPLGALFLGVTWMLLRVSHRVAGPLYRFRQVFKRVSAGDLSVRVRIRHGDYLTEESDELDRMIATVRDRVSQARAAAGALQEDLTKLAASAERVTSDQVAALSARAAETEKILAGFIIDPAVTVARADLAKGTTHLRPSLGQALLIGAIALYWLYWLVAMTAPAYTEALARAIAMRTIAHHPITK